MCPYAMCTVFLIMHHPTHISVQKTMVIENFITDYVPKYFGITGVRKIIHGEKQS